MEDFVVLMRDPSARGWYLAGGFALMVLPMVIMAIWYHRKIVTSPGGRALMKRQWANPPMSRTGIGGAQRQLSEGISMMRDVARGRYGQHARQMQNTVYWIVGVWIVAVSIYFGLLLWADEVNRPLLP